MLTKKQLMILSTLEDIIISLELIKKRSTDIKSSDDFLNDENGLLNLDAISMRLIAIGEGFKNIDKLSDHTLLEKYSQVPWKEVKGIRDILSHHYFQLDAEIIFNVCQNDLEQLLHTAKQIDKDIRSINAK